MKTSKLESRTLTQWLPILFFLVLSCAWPRQAHAVEKARQLPPYYRQWLEEQVPYIISSEERRAYLALHTDVERDNFIAAFWEARNPTPGTGYNTFKEEYFRRLTYASEKYGSMRYHDGWRTEQGRIYITLGPPKATQVYHLTANIRDMEIWFYQTPSPALPSFFNVVFFRPGVGEDYKIYSPRSDGPYRLVTTGQQDNKAAMHVIQQQLGPEIAHAALSLIPSEPVDLDSATPSIDSEIMLNTIYHLPDNPLEKSRISAAHAREAAGAGILVSAGPQELETTVLHDERGRLTLSYLLRNRDPNSALVGTRKDGAQGYSIALRSTLATAEGKAVYQQQNSLEGILTPAQLQNARSRSFAAEDRLPVVPGDYQLEIAEKNNLTGLETIFHGKLTVPETTAGALGISPLVVYNGSPAEDRAHALPFSYAGLRFAPRSAGVATLHVGESLPLVFQLHLPPPAAGQPRPATIHLHYLYGQLTGASGAPGEFDEDIDGNSADPAGNILDGHKLPTFDLPAGNYRVVVRATTPTGALAGSAALQLRVVPASVPIETWTAYGPEPPQTLHLDDVKRGMAAAALGHPDQAATWYRSALREFSEEPRALNLLALTLSTQKQNDQLATLADQPQFTHAVDPETTVLVADGLLATGAAPRAITLLNAQIALQPPSAELFHALSRCYTATGKADLARDFAQKAAALTH